jgi:hypothetical protein
MSEAESMARDPPQTALVILNQTLSMRRLLGVLCQQDRCSINNEMGNDVDPEIPSPHIK